MKRESIFALLVATLIAVSACASNRGSLPASDSETGVRPIPNASAAGGGMMQPDADCPMLSAGTAAEVADGGMGMHGPMRRGDAGYGMMGSPMGMRGMMRSGDTGPAMVRGSESVAPCMAGPTDGGRVTMMGR
jgi:hypothetical protein